MRPRTAYALRLLLAVTWASRPRGSLLWPGGPALAPMAQRVRAEERTLRSFWAKPLVFCPKWRLGELAAAVGSVAEGYCVILVLTVLVAPGCCENDKHVCLFIYKVERQAGPSEVHHIYVIVKC